MRIYKRGAVWWVYFITRDGRKVRQSTKQTDRVRAAAVARDAERRLADPTYRASTETSLSAAVRRYILDVENAGRAPDTLKSYRTKVRHLVRVLGADTTLEHITAARVDHYIETRRGEGAKRHTIHKELVCLRGTLKLARRRGEFDRELSQVMPFRFSTGYKPLERYLPEAKARAVVEALPAKWAGPVAFMLATGPRRGETERAELGDVDLDAGEIHIRGTKTSGAKRTIPILSFTDWFARHAMASANGRGRKLFWRWSGDAKKHLDAALKAQGIEHLSPNDLRRSLGKWLRVRGVHPAVIAQILGHKDSRMAERVYGRVEATAMRDHLERLIAVHPVHTSPRKRTDSVGGVDGVPGQKARETVPRDGIEPPTRGFSGLDKLSKTARKRLFQWGGVHPAYTKPEGPPPGRMFVLDGRCVVELEAA